MLSIQKSSYEVENVERARSDLLVINSKIDCLSLLGFKLKLKVSLWQYQINLGFLGLINEREEFN